MGKICHVRGRGGRGICVVGLIFVPVCDGVFLFALIYMEEGRR